MKNNSIKRHADFRFLANTLLMITLAAASVMSSSSSFAQAKQPSSASGQALVAGTSFRGYEVISVKSHKGDDSVSMDVGEGSLHLVGVDIRTLLMNAYGVRPDLVLGLPSWAEKSRWDIDAKIVDPDRERKSRQLTREQEEALTRKKFVSILVDRFDLKAHESTANRAVYELVVAKEGSKLKTTKASAREMGGMVSGTGTLKGTGISISSLCFALSMTTGREVVDKTGFKGEYDIDLKWSDENGASPDSDSGERPPMLPTALEEQLGLRLVSSRGDVRSVVVDSVETPTAN